MDGEHACGEYPRLEKYNGRLHDSSPHILQPLRVVSIAHTFD